MVRTLAVPIVQACGAVGQAVERVRRQTTSRGRHAPVPSDRDLSRVGTVRAGRHARHAQRGRARRLHVRLGTPVHEVAEYLLDGQGLSVGLLARP